jgi:hypothetical protein
MLAETVGLSKIDDSDPANSVVLKERGRNMNLRVPKLWDEKLPTACGARVNQPLDFFCLLIHSG